MFEVGFTEIVLILGLALLVLGPEKLPGLAEKVGRWSGRARAMARQLRTQLEHEVTMEELSRSRAAEPQPSSASAPTSTATPESPAPTSSAAPPPETPTTSSAESQPHATAASVEPAPEPPPPATPNSAP